MQNRKTISILVFIIVLLSLSATLTGILSGVGAGSCEYQFESIHGQKVTIYGKGLYQHMSSDVAIQGIAQDYVTLFIGVPALLFALFLARKGTLRSKLLLAGIVSYFFLTYLFYMNMAMYNAFFLVYVILTGTTFFALLLTIMSIEIDTLSTSYSKSTPVKVVGGFLIFTASMIALHLVAPIVLIFLSLLMTALVAKIIAMAFAGVNVLPAIFIIPLTAILAITCTIILMKNIQGSR